MYAVFACRVQVEGDEEDCRAFWDGWYSDERDALAVFDLFQQRYPTLQISFVRKLETIAAKSPISSLHRAQQERH